MSKEYIYKIRSVKKGHEIQSSGYDSNQNKITEYFSLSSLVDIDILCSIESSHKDILERRKGLEEVVTILK